MNELPVIVTLVLGFLGVIFSVFNQNRRFDDLKEAIYQRFDQADRRSDDIIKRLERIEDKLDNHEVRIVRLVAAQ